ncbi:MAG: hypothetical protein JSW47_11490 [Phycisphaerales bacterium]|nr:MAG: hypothetical protein JSW47_11490 [Phycisphaerales bacterium]
MFALIRREIRDHVVFFIAAMVLAGTATGVLISMLGVRGRPEAAIFESSAGATILVIIVLGFFAMGAVQMYTDRIRKISAFVSTLSVNRSRILLAKIFTGLLAILTALVPLAVAVAILHQIDTPPVPMYVAIARDVFAGVFLTTFACYCIGLQVGWNCGKIAPALGGMGLTCILASLVFIKGFAPELMIMLALFIAASLIWTWHNFTSTSL